MSDLAELRARARRHERRMWHRKAVKPLSCGIGAAVIGQGVRADRDSRRVACSGVSLDAAAPERCVEVPRTLAAMPRIQRDAQLVRDYKQQLRRQLGGALRCESCGWTPPDPTWDSLLHAHHVVPLQHDGRDERWNLIVLCPNDHALAHRLWDAHRAFLDTFDRGWPRRNAERDHKFNRVVLMERLAQWRQPA